MKKDNTTPCATICEPVSDYKYEKIVIRSVCEIMNITSHCYEIVGAAKTSCKEIHQFNMIRTASYQ